MVTDYRGHHRTLLPAPKHAPLEFECKIYRPARELNPAPPIDHSGPVHTVSQSPEPPRQVDNDDFIECVW